MPTVKLSFERVETVFCFENVTAQGYGGLQCHREMINRNLICARTIYSRMLTKLTFNERGSRLAYVDVEVSDACPTRMD